MKEGVADWKCGTRKFCVGQNPRGEASVCRKWEGAILRMVGNGVITVEVSGIREIYRMILPGTGAVATDTNPEKRCVGLPALGGGERCVNFDRRSVGVVKGSDTKRNGENGYERGKEKDLSMCIDIAINCTLWKIPRVNLTCCKENLV